MNSHLTKNPERCPINSDRRRFLTTACCLGPTLALAACRQSGAPRDSEPAPSPLGTEDRIGLALKRFKEGYHCSQSVLEAYAGDFAIEPAQARRLGSALAGGSTVGGECGAVGSGYLVLGLRHARSDPSYGDVERENELWNRVRSFVAEFENRHGALTCRDLLGVDVFTRAGRREALRRNLFVTRCHGYIEEAITLLDALA